MAHDTTMKVRAAPATREGRLRDIDRAYVARVVEKDEQYPRVDRGVLVALLRAIDATHPSAAPAPVRDETQATIDALRSRGFVVVHADTLNKQQMRHGEMRMVAARLLLLECAPYVYGNENTPQDLEDRLAAVLSAEANAHLAPASPEEGREVDEETMLGATSLGGYRFYTWMGRESWQYVETHDGCMSRDQARVEADAHRAVAPPATREGRADLRELFEEAFTAWYDAACSEDYGTRSRLIDEATKVQVRALTALAPTSAAPGGPTDRELPR